MCCNKNIKIEFITDKLVKYNMNITKISDKILSKVRLKVFYLKNFSLFNCLQKFKTGTKMCLENNIYLGSIYILKDTFLIFLPFFLLFIINSKCVKQEMCLLVSSVMKQDLSNPYFVIQLCNLSMMHNK